MQIAVAAASAAVWRGRAMLALAALGVALSLYLVWIRYTGAPPVCVGASGCGEVQTSRFAVVAGIPIVLLGLGLYLGLLALSVWRVLAGSATPALVALGLFGLALAGVLYSAYLTYLELFVLGAICSWCVTSAVLLVGLCGLSAWDLRASEQDYEVLPGEPPAGD